MEYNEKFCQSCGMPLKEESIFGTNADGSKNEDYCLYCYDNGAFKDSMTMEQMIDFCLPHFLQANPNVSEQEARNRMQEFFPKLKRWQ